MARNSRQSIIPGVKAKIEGVGSDTMRWTSKYGCAAVVSFDGGATDGLNEKGLAAHLLVLDESQLEAPDGRPVLPDIHWAQYVLDNFATVNEVVEAHRGGDFRVAAAWSTDLGYSKHLPTHLAVQDSSGNSAIIEYVKGKLVIHHGPEYRVMTNDPPYDEMVERVKQYAPFGGTKPLPGGEVAGGPICSARQLFKVSPGSEELFRGRRGRAFAVADRAGPVQRSRPCSE